MTFQLPQNTKFHPTINYRYILSGCHTHSEIPLTSVSRSTLDVERADVLIQMGHGVSPIEETGARMIFEHFTELSRIRIGTVADFEIRAGKVITVWPAAGATQNDIEIFLCGPVWATLCHQRGLLPLHASAIVGDRGIVAFAGHSGAGKSTTAALMHSEDCRLFADDILPIAFIGNSDPGAWPYLRRLKLRGDSIVQLALTPAAPVSERLDKEKSFVELKYLADDKWSRLERLYLLDIANDSTSCIERLVGAEAVHTLIAQTYHRDFIILRRWFDKHLTLCAKLASKIAIYRLCRPALLGSENEYSHLIKTHMKNAAV